MVMMRSQDQPGLAAQRLGELVRIARVGAGDGGRHADLLAAPRVMAADRIAQGAAGRQVEADGDGGKLVLVIDGERRGAALDLAPPRSGAPARRPMPAAGGHVDPRQGGRIALVLRHGLEHDAILVGLGIDGRDLALAEGVVERVVDGLHGDAEAAGRLAVDAHHDAQAAVLGFRDDLAQGRREAQLLGEAGRPGARPPSRRCRPACTGTAPG